MAEPGVVRQARRDRRQFIVGLVVLGVASAILFLVATANSGFPLARTTSVQAAFLDVGALQEGSEVREHSQRIGRVDAIEYRDGKAIVTLELEGDKEVYQDARAFIWDFSALGQKIVELRRGTPDAGPLGSNIIADARTTPSVDLAQALDVFDAPTRKRAQVLLQQLGGGLTGGEQALQGFLQAAPDLLDDVGTISGTLSSDRADLPGLLARAEGLSARFDGRDDDIEALVRQMDTTMRSLGVDDGKPLREAVSKLPSSLDAARKALSDLDRPLADTQAAVSTLRPAAGDLSAATPSLRATLRESVTPLGRLEGVAEDALPAVAELTRTFADARPLAPAVVRALSDLAVPLAALAPYGQDLSNLFVRGNSFVSESSAPGVHYARLGLGLSLTTLTDGLISTPQLKPRNPYPTPGQADDDRQEGLR